VSLVEDLLDFLTHAPNCVAEQVDADEIEASLVSSLHHARMRDQLELYLSFWEASHPETAVEVVDER
jgi:hypothetical protein